MNRAAGPALCLLLCAALAGCGDGQATVSGTVKFEGQPVPAGSIVFAKEGGGATEGAVIKDGAFEARLPPGRYKIEVRATKVVGKRKQKGFDGKEEEVEMTDELIPERYNTRTELSEEFKSGSNTLALDLKGK